uniref:Homing endonuclease LAGLIDADG domain-containing protein n=1 Tax=Tanacetum cinerariifolium TaxID=118510 RepID=A0A699JHR5_TANCI|nr:hypothetical protein [Tanacetum cinerariifolium]
MDNENELMEASLISNNGFLPIIEGQIDNDELISYMDTNGCLIEAPSSASSVQAWPSEPQTCQELYAHLVSCLGQEVMDTLFGILLGDARLNFTSFAKASAYIEQSQIHASYLVALYGALIHLAVKAPKLRYHGKFRKDGSEIVSAGFSLASSSELGILAYLFYIPRESRDSTWCLPEHSKLFTRRCNVSTLDTRNASWSSVYASH